MQKVVEMDYYKESSRGDIVCLLCRHECRLSDGKIGVCGVNRNSNGRLETLTYGHPAAVNVDPIEKKPLYHVSPQSNVLSLGTIGCNFKCPFCQNWNISQEKKLYGSIDVKPKELVDLAIEYNCNSIAYTYNEPTVFYPYAKDIGLVAKDRGLKNFFITNGFETPEIIEDMSSWIDAVNVDLKSWDRDYYKKVLKGNLESVKDSIKLMTKYGIWMEITTLLIEDENDAEDDIRGIARFIADELGENTPWHISAFHPSYKMKNHLPTTISKLQKAYEIAKGEGLNYVYMGNVSQGGDTFCPDCGELLIARNNFNVTTNRLVDGCCPKCDRKIEGIWR